MGGGCQKVYWKLQVCKKKEERRAGEMRVRVRAKEGGRGGEGGRPR